MRRSRGGGGAAVAHQLSATSYWSIAQMVAQHTVGGCNLQPGDLLGTGTVSGPSAGEAGAMIELSGRAQGAGELELERGERRFLQDGD